MTGRKKTPQRIRSLPDSVHQGHPAGGDGAVCSFCGKNQAEAGRLLQGRSDSCICVACLISVNAELIEDERDV